MTEAQQSKLLSSGESIRKHMVWVTARRFAGLALAVVVFVGALAGVAAAQPSVSVSVDGEEVTDGSTVETGSDPELDISVEANKTIEFVEVRVDGESRERYSPDSESFSETLTLELDNGEHDVEVVANTDEATTLEVTILKDSGRPFVEYTNPFETPGRGAPPSITTVSDAQVDLAGDLFDDTGVENIEIERTFQYRYAEQETSREFYELEDPGDSFSQELFLGDGDNQITARYTDRLGNIRRHEFTLDVRDNEDPTVDLSVPGETTSEKITIDGTVSDNVKVQTFTITANGNTRTLVGERSPEPDRDRLSVDFQTNVSLLEGENTITVEATDNSDNTVTREFDVVYNRQIVPDIVIDCERTGLESGQMAVRGSVEQGEITSVRLESVATESGEIVTITSIYEGGVTDQVTVDETLGVAAGETRMRLVVTDSQDDQHEQSFLVNPVTGGVFLDGGAGCDPSVPSTATPTETPTATATATATGTAADESPDASPTPDDSGGGESGGGSEDAPQAEEDTSQTDGDDETNGGSGPGFTVLVSLVAVLFVAVHIARRE